MESLTRWQCDDWIFSKAEEQPSFSIKCNMEQTLCNTKEGIFKSSKQGHVELT